MCSPVRILIVDDHPDGRDSLVALLQSFGYEVFSACDGREGLAAAQKLRPAVIFTDIGMPQMDGLALAAAIRADPSLNDTYIVAVSGWGAGCDRAREAQVRFNRHLVKPAQLEAILDAIDQACLGGTLRGA